MYLLVWPALDCWHCRYRVKRRLYNMWRMRHSLLVHYKRMHSSNLPIRQIGWHPNYGCWSKCNTVNMVNLAQRGRQKKAQEYIWQKGSFIIGVSVWGTHGKGIDNYLASKAFMCWKKDNVTRKRYNNTIPRSDKKLNLCWWVALRRKRWSSFKICILCTTRVCNGGTITIHLLLATIALFKLRGIIWLDLSSMRPIWRYPTLFSQISQFKLELLNMKVKPFHLSTLDIKNMQVHIKTNTQCVLYIALTYKSVTCLWQPSHSWLYCSVRSRSSACKDEWKTSISWARVIQACASLICSSLKITVSWATLCWIKRTISFHQINSHIPTRLFHYEIAGRWNTFPT